MTNREKFTEYKKNPTIELRNEIVEEHLYMVDILIRKYLNKGCLLYTSDAADEL